MGTTAEVPFPKHLVSLGRQERDSGHVAGAGGVSTWCLTKERNTNPLALGETSSEKKAGCFMNDFSPVSRICLMRAAESLGFTLLSSVSGGQAPERVVNVEMVNQASRWALLPGGEPGAFNSRSQGAGLRSRLLSRAQTAAPI